MINNMFQINVCKQKLNINNKDIIKHVLNLKKKTKGRKISNATGWQSFDLDINKKPLLELNKEIIKNSVDYMKSISLKNTSLKISNMWSNVNGYKDYNLIHSHHSSIISGVYYLKVPKDCGKIFFVNPAADGIQYSWENCIEEYTQQNSEYWFMDIEENNLMFFPSWLKHGVESNLNKQEDRISISFNIT